MESRWARLRYTTCMLNLFLKVGAILLMPLAAGVLFVAAYFFFYDAGGYDPPERPAVSFAEVGRPASNFTTFSEVPLQRDGVLLFDGVHRNDFTEDEISVLRSRAEDRGYQARVMGAIGRLGGASAGLRDRLSMLDEGLREADSLVVVLPRTAYESEEVDLIERFVRKGGKLLLVGDPTRDSQINTVAERFGIAYQPDYLYNMARHDLNFQNILVRDFSQDEITQGLAEVALYTAGSIKSRGTDLALADAGTRSSRVEGVEAFSPIVKAGEGLVLAIHDLTFMVPPQNAILDNDRLISNIADYLTDSRRAFELADFPHYFRDEVDILLGGSGLFDVGTEFKTMLEQFGRTPQLRGLEDISRDTVFLGLYEDVGAVDRYLAAAGIQVDDVLRTRFSPDVPTLGTAIILLHRTKERHVMVVLGGSKRSLLDMARRLEIGQFRDGLVSELLGVYSSF